MITPQQLKNVFPLCKQCGPWVRIFNQMVDEFELRPAHRLAMFLAQCGYESDSFRRVREDMSYSADQLVKTWPHLFPNRYDENTQKYQRNPAGLANFVYANRNGNGGPETGDGLKYRGGGLIQLTGKANYTEVGRALNLRLDVSPQMIEQPLVAARTAGYFWKLKDLNAAADEGDFDHTTLRINGTAMEGAEERRKLWLALVAQNIDGVRTIPGTNKVPGPPPAPVPEGTIDGLSDPNYRPFGVAARA